MPALGMRVLRMRGVPMRLRHERGAVIVVRWRRILARQPVARADERDRAGNDGAQERQEDDSLVHLELAPAVLRRRHPEVAAKQPSKGESARAVALRGEL